MAETATNVHRNCILNTKGPILNPTPPGRRPLKDSLKELLKGALVGALKESNCRGPRPGVKQAYQVGTEDVFFFFSAGFVDAFG